MKHTPLRFSRRGSFYIPFVSILLIVFLIMAYIQIRTDLNPSGNDPASNRITRDIGGKQGEILRAVREGERVRLYVEEAARIARAGTASGYVCGTPYLNYYRISPEGSSCDQTPSSFANNLFVNALAEYPRGSLASMFGEPIVTNTSGGAVLRYEGSHRIPIAGGEIAGQTATGGSAGAAGSFSGALEGWPTSDPRITSLFGKRDLQGQSGSRNHAGIDIGTHGKAGTEVRALVGGVASYYADGDASFVAVDTGSAVFEYVHVSPGGVVGTRRGVNVNPGDIIAVSTAYASGEHLHLQIYVKDITRSTVESIASWRGHIGTATAQPVGLTYAVVKTTTNKAYLDPLCFFDRGFIDQKIRSSGTDWYARRAQTGNSVYETCDVYERDLGLSRRFASIGANAGTTLAGSTPASPVPSPPSSTGTTSTVTPDTNATPAAPTSPAESTNERVRRTYENLNRQGLIEAVRAAADENEFDASVSFALITQESEGVADAVSPTGCVGIGQFCYTTAQNYPDIFTKLTQCRCSGAACRDQNQRQCSPGNDDRFDAQKSVEASARLIGGHLKAYERYDQQVALALVAYNAGPGVVRQVLAKTGPNPSWSQVRAILQTDTSINYGDNIDPSAKRIEVVAYVDRITQTYIPAWGGSFIGGGSYTSDIPGFYTFRQELTIDLTKTASAVIERIEDTIASCETTECIRESVVDTANANGARAEREPLNSNSGCMIAAERAQAYLARQFLHCKSTPDDACGCALFESVEASYTVTPTETRITKYKGIDVNPSAFATMPGVGFERGGESSSLASVVVLKGLGDTSEVALREPSIDLSLSERRDDTRVSLTLARDVTVDALWKSDSLGGLALGQGTLTNANTCVLPESFRPEAYCLTSSDGRFEPTVFYVDMRANSTPNYDARQYDADDGGALGAIGQAFGAGGSTSVRFFTDRSFPYAKLIATETVNGVPKVEERYFRVIEGDREAYDELKGAIEGLVSRVTTTSIAGVRVVERFKGDVIVTAPSTEYKRLHKVVVPGEFLRQGVTVDFVLLDENLREGERFRVDMDLTKETSGFVIVESGDIVPGVIPVPGIS